MNTETDEILEGLRPRMRRARVTHLRRLVAGVAMVPLVGFGAVAMAADSADAPSIEIADRPEGLDTDAPVVELPEIGEAGGAAAPDGGGEHGGAEPAADPDDSSEPVEETKVLSLGPLGAAEVSVSEDALSLLETDLAPGWELISVETTDDGLVVVVKKHDAIKVVTIRVGVRGEIDVDIRDLVLPTTTTTTTTAPPPTTTEKPHEDPTPIVDRFVVEVPGKGSFVVEREGETLWVGNVETNEGYDSHVEKAEGWKVWVRFTDGEWNWYGKAFINDHGEVEQHFWDEAVPFEPIYQWVEVSGVGAVKFKLWSDGLVYVKEWTTAEGFGFWDYHEGAPAEVAKVDFEGEGTLWIVEAWRNEDGGLSWSTTDMSPE